jgi:hypothetical protein
MRRVHHPFWLWEDLRMWRDVSEADQRRLLVVAVEFTGNAPLYGQWMLRVLDAMPIACEHNLTEPSLNRQAWIGHAACFLATECPEYVTREAWGKLTQRQRDEANAQADRAIHRWEVKHAQEDRRLHPQLDFEGIPGWAA